MLDATRGQRDRQPLRLIADVACNDVDDSAGFSGDVDCKGVVAARIGDAANAQVGDADTGATKWLTGCGRDLACEDGGLCRGFAREESDCQECRQCRCHTAERGGITTHD